MKTVFQGLNDVHFDAYAPSKWSSMAHNLSRMKTKDQMVALCTQVSEETENVLENLDRGASDEIPNITNQKKVDAQWVYWYRNKAERDILSSFLQKTPLDQASIFTTAPKDKHLTLAIILRHESIWVGLMMAPSATVDRKNFATKLERDEFLEKLPGFAQDMDEKVVVDFGTSQTVQDAFSIESIQSMRDALKDSNETWSLGITLPQDEVQNAGAALSQIIANWLVKLFPLYDFIAWSKENDFIQASKKILQEKLEKQAKAAAYKAGDRVRITSGIFAGKIGAIHSVSKKGQIKVHVGKMSVLIDGGSVVCL